MENKLALADQNLQTLCPGGNRLSKESGLIFSVAVNKMALAKNIKLAEGTLGAWEECLIEDINKKSFDFEDFIRAMELVIRRPAYNRIDYSDIYAAALDIAFKRFEKMEPKNANQDNEIYSRLVITTKAINELTPLEEPRRVSRVLRIFKNEDNGQATDVITLPLKTMLEGIGERI